MTNLEMPWALIVTKWFICLFAEVLPIEVTINNTLQCMTENFLFDFQSNSGQTFFY